MGFNIAGIVINKNLESSKETIESILKVNLVLERTIDFETASDNDKEEDIIDVYFGDNGTLIFANEDHCLNDGYTFHQTDILTFAVSETAMVYSFHYSENGKIIRSKMEVKGEIIDDEATNEATKNEEVDIASLIWQYINQVLGQSYFSIKPDEKVFRYTIQETLNTCIELEPKVDTSERVTIYNMHQQETSKQEQSEYNNFPIEPTKGKLNLKILLLVIAVGLFLLFGIAGIAYAIFYTFIA